MVLTSSIRDLAVTLFLFVSADLLHSFHVLSQHTVFSRDIAFYIQSFVLRHKKDCRDRFP